MKVGFIGLGIMGKPMAMNIHKAGFSLLVYNRTKSKAREFSEIAKVCDSILELAEQCDIIISMVTGPQDVKEVMLGNDGVASKAKKGTIAIDMSTIGPKAAREIAEELGKEGILFIDAPVTGSTYRAQSGELTIFAGGESAAFEEAKPVLLAMGKDLHHMGEAGMGQAIKLVNNAIGAAANVALAEAMLLCDAQGLKREKGAKALENTPGMSPTMKVKIQNYVKKEYPLAFTVDNLLKDLRLAKQEKDKELPLLTLLEKLYAETSKSGFGNDDVSAVMKILEKPNLELPNDKFV